MFEQNEKTKYVVLLMELGLTNICHDIAKLQQTYANQFRWETDGTHVQCVMMEDFRIRGDRSMLVTYDKVAEKYSLRHG